MKKEIASRRAPTPEGRVLKPFARRQLSQSPGCALKYLKLLLLLLVLLITTTNAS